jgi:CBS domain-containing protein
VVTERDLFALQRLGIRSIHGALARASQLGDLRQAAADIRALARSLMGEGIAAEPLTLIISALNDALAVRAIELERPRHALDGLDWGWLGFGSEGRREQTISTDQDNGIIFAAPPGEPARSARERLLPLARAVNTTLDACGYPRCAGGIMAGNEQWCLSLDEWGARFDGWIANTDPRALLEAAIFFDFRLLYGKDELLEAMRGRVSAAARATPRFLRQMAEAALQTRPPLGILGDFLTEADAEGGPPVLDLKKSGARLFVDAARVLALGAGVGAAIAAERLRQAGAKLGVPAEETASAVEAFFFIQLLRLRGQAAAQGGTAANPNLVRPRHLNEVDGRTLKECLRQARRLQSRRALDHQL